MNLDVSRISTDHNLYSSLRSEEPTWKYDLLVGDYIFTFSGSNKEKKVFAAFQNVGSYRKALTNIIEFLRIEVEKIQTLVNSQAVVVNHNFVETCKHIRDPISDLLPKLYGKLSHDDKVQQIADHIEKTNKLDVAMALLDIDRTITNLQTQISGMQIIAGEYKADFSVSHPLVALLDSVLIPFDQSFDGRSIRVVNSATDSIHDQRNIALDYTLLNWALYHLLNNAVKYCYAGSDLIIRSDSANKKIIFDMCSLRVDLDEAENIFKLNTRGKHATGFAGDGLGMYFAKKSLDVMGAKISFLPGTTVLYTDKDHEFCANQIEILLK